MSAAFTARPQLEKPWPASALRPSTKCQWRGRTAKFNSCRS